MDYRRINFDRELGKGVETYEKKLGKWWLNRSNDASHLYAYRRISAHLEQVARTEPKKIIDYGCGAGHVLTRLYRRFPSSRIIGIDGSEFMLKRASERLRAQNRVWNQRVDLIQSKLPNFSLPEFKADAVFFVFPNIVPDPEEDDDYRLTSGDRAVAEYLSEAREPDPEEETVEDDAETLCDDMLTENTVSWNLRELMKRGGICIRAEYANAPREEMTKLVQLRMAFQEGSLATRVNGKKAERFFSLRDSTYHRSKVVEDVYHQTRDETDLEGGYLLSTLVAI